MSEAVFPDDIIEAQEKRIAELEALLRAIDRKVLADGIVHGTVRVYWHEEIQEALSEGGADE